MGAGIAAFAGTAGLEQQKAQLANQSAILADQLATTRETALEGQRQTFQTGLEGQRQTFQAGQTAQTLAAEAARTATTEAGASSRNAATIAAENERQQNLLNAPAPEIKSAQQFAKLSPDEKQAFREQMMTKAGLPPWMIGAGTDNPAPPSGSSSAAPSSSDATAPLPDGTTSVASDASAPEPAARPAGGLRNDKALDGIPPGAASIVKGMVDGRISPPSSFALSKPYWQGMIAKAADYDPNFDQTTWAGRVATRKDFADGQAAKGVTAINTALAHAGTLVGDFDALNNWSFTPANVVGNAIESTFGDSRQTKAAQTVDALASEARKVFSASGGGNLTELQEWQKSFPLNGSPDQQHAALRGFVELLDGRLQALADQYNRGMGRTDDPISLLQPKARAVYEKLTGREPENATGYQTGKAPTSAPAAPAIPPWVKPGDQYSPSRGQARGADGTTYGPPQ
jgi:hypothetical protein